MTSLQRISAGFRTDMNTLLEKFVAAETARFTEFSKLFREMKFSLIFCGKKEKESRLFFDEITRIILKLWHPSCSLQEKIFATYLLYAVYVMQPYTPKFKIRLRLSDFQRSEEVLQLAYKDQHLDVCYAIHRMRRERCFHFVAFLKKKSPCNAVDEEEEDDEHSATLQAEVLSNMGKICKGGSLQCIEEMHKEYSARKAKLASPAVGDLTMVDENAAEGLIGDFNKLQAEYKFEPEESAAGGSGLCRKESLEAASGSGLCREESSSSEEEMDIASRRRALRQQQFSSTPTTRKERRFQQLLEEPGTSDSGERTLPVLAAGGSGLCRKESSEAASGSGLCREESSSSEEEMDIASRRRALRQQQFSSTPTTRKGRRFQQLLEEPGTSDSGEA